MQSITKVNIIICSPFSSSFVYTEPQLHLICTGIGSYVGYCAHRYEEGAEERTQLLLAKYRHAPREWVEMVKVDSDRGKH